MNFRYHLPNVSTEVIGEGKDTRTGKRCIETMKKELLQFRERDGELKPERTLNETGGLTSSDQEFSATSKTRTGES